MADIDEELGVDLARQAKDHVAIILDRAREDLAIADNKNQTNPGISPKEAKTDKLTKDVKSQPEIP